MCSGRVGSSCSSCGTRRATLVTNPVISHEWEMNRVVLTTSGTFPWYMHRYSGTVKTSHGGIQKTFEVTTLTC
jgi:hypothetical protein